MMLASVTNIEWFILDSKTDSVKLYKFLSGIYFLF